MTSRWGSRHRRGRPARVERARHVRHDDERGDGRGADGGWSIGLPRRKRPRLRRRRTGCGQKPVEFRPGETDCAEIGCAGGPTLWSSVDGSTWDVTTLPVGAGVETEDGMLRVTSVGSVTVSALGYVAVGGKWLGRLRRRHETWVSDDGATWVMLPQPDVPTVDYGPGLVADGPIGVIGISASATEGEQVIWQLR